MDRRRAGSDPRLPPLGLAGVILDGFETRHDEVLHLSGHGTPPFDGSVLNFFGEFRCQQALNAYLEG